MNCKNFQDQLPDLLLDSDPVTGALTNPSAIAEVNAHLASCPPCTQEYAELRSMFGMLDQWTAPEPTPYFDQKLAVRVREAQAEPVRNWFERLQDRVLFNTGRQFRPAMAGALGLVLALGGASSIAIHNSIQPPVVEASETVQDLQIFDRNDKTFQQMDQLLQDEEPASNEDAPAATAPPIS